VSRFQTRQDLADKIEWEGGIEPSLDYGIKSSDMPDPELEAAWLILQTRWGILQEQVNVVRKLLPG